MKNIITISGDPASGKTTCIRGLKQRLEDQGLDVKVISIGEIFRHEAEKRELTIEEFTAQLENVKSEDMDLYIEGLVAKLGTEIEAKQQDGCVYIVDSRMAWHTIPNSFKVKLEVNSNVAGSRSFNDETRGEEDSYDTLEDAIKYTEQRKQTDIRKFKKKYGVDISDPENFDVVIDTSYAAPEDTHGCICECFNKYRQDKFFNKRWTSPRELLPSQNIMQTIRGAEELTESIKKNGYDQTFPIEVVDIYGLPFIDNGHHRAYCAYAAGKTLVPYEYKEVSQDTIDSCAQTFARIGISHYADYEDSFFEEFNEYEYRSAFGRKVVVNGNFGKIYGKGIYNGELIRERMGEIERD